MRFHHLSPVFAPFAVVGLALLAGSMWGAGSGVAVAGAGESGAGSSPAEPAAAPAPAAGAGKIGFVDVDEMFRRHEPFRAEFADLERDHQRNAARVAQKQEELKSLKERIFLAPRDGYHARRLASERGRLEGEVKFLDEMNGREHESRRARVQAKYFDRFREAVTRYGSDNGYTAIFQWRTLPAFSRPGLTPEQFEEGLRAATTLYSDRRGADLTAEILKMLEK
ncbi:MAG: OmpH family outer membrane protein [Planctomycetes bacterium]|nr:OmpH family outer membrane protein [Planctomycetota bacterium]